MYEHDPSARTREDQWKEELDLGGAARSALARRSDPGPGCCPSCNGHGVSGLAASAEANGGCADCLGTGHAHDSSDPCDEAPEADPGFREHDCREESVEVSSHPTRSGRVTVTQECPVCGTILAQWQDSVL